MSEAVEMTWVEDSAGETEAEDEVVAERRMVIHDIVLAGTPTITVGHMELVPMIQHIATIQIQVIR